LSWSSQLSQESRQVRHRQTTALTPRPADNNRIKIAPAS
jgi:hypothetical protein